MHLSLLLMPPLAAWLLCDATYVSMIAVQSMSVMLGGVGRMLLIVPSPQGNQCT